MALILPFQLLFLQICYHYATAQTVVLDSSVACPGEVVTYTCTVRQGAVFDWIVEPFLPASARIQFMSTAAIGSSLECSSSSSNDSSAVNCAVLDFVASLTNRTNPTTVPGGTVADMTSTLTFTATVRLNGTVVQCQGTTADAIPVTNITLNVAGLPSPPLTPSYTVQQYGRNNVTLTVQWPPPQYDGGAPVNYTITVSPGLIPVTTSETSVPVTVPYNVIHTVSIVATNCNGSSSAAMVTVPSIVNCSDPTPPTDGSIDPFQNTTEGAVIFFRCNEMFVPTGRMRAVCGADRRWSPDPGNLTCIFHCSSPGNPQRGSTNYTNTTEGSVAFYSCDQYLVPEGRMRANCTRNGWSPIKPGLVNCTEVDCGAPPRPVNGSLQLCTSTTAGSEVVFWCDPGFVPERVMTAVCGSDGQWTPNPGNVTCSPRPTQILVPVITAVVSCAVSFILGSLVGGVVHCCTVRKKSKCDKIYLTKKEQQQPVYDIVGHSQSIELKENVAYVDCGVPHAPENGIIDNIQSISTVGGSQIFFRCNPRYVPAGRMSATCRSPDGMSAVGTWTPDPADLVCNASGVVCEEPTPPSGVIVLEPHNITVSSVIFYQCQQSGFTPSPPSSLCGENGEWRPDPSQVVCEMITATPTATGPTVDTGGLGGGAVAAIVIVLLLVVALCVAVVIVLGFIWWRKQSDVSSKPPTQGDDYEMVGGPEKPAPYKGYMDQGPGTEAEYTVVSDIPAPSKPVEPHYDLPPGSNHPEGLVYASVEIKPKKPSAPPKPVKEDDRVEYAAIAYQPKDAAKNSQAAAATAPKTKRYPDADELVNLDNLLIQLRDVTPMWFDLGDALDLPPSILDDIRGQFETNPQQCMIEVVDAWLQRHLSRGSPTWTEVAEALRKINQNGLADALESVYYTGDLPISVNMNEIPAFPADNDGSPPPIPIRGTLTDDVEPAPPKPPKSWGTPEKKAPPQRPPRGGSGRRPPPRPPKPSAP